MRVRVALSAVLSALHVLGWQLQQKKKKADHSNGNVANLYFSLTVSSIMLTITPQDEYC